MLFDLLSGVWRLKRRIVGSQKGLVLGKATFTPLAEGTLTYKEQGRLRSGGFSYQVEQNYIFEVKSDHNLIVRFSDGQSYLDLRFNGDLEAEGLHICGQDRYQAFYRLKPGQLESHVIVLGPQKDYEIFTSLHKGEPRFSQS
ncbi:MAG: DUF6314 family protein [Myxococcota bacterium]